ncbi:zeta toxin family protein [Streptomyces sp. NPDC005784]|uniref:zeta toxin family protein n=1 Tax=Streptomyces sp. NPDC005784 TaxID=3364731 RepID=UPI0036A2AE6D
MLHQVILASATQGAVPQHRPVVVVVAGQPGAGKTETADLLQAVLDRHPDPARHAAPDESAHPHADAHPDGGPPDERGYRGFRNVRATATRPAAAPKPSRPGLGRPAGSKNKHRAKCHDVGKTVKRAESIKEHQARRG